MNITFQNPWMLVYLVSIPFLIVLHFLFLKYNHKKAMRFANFETLKRVAGEKLLTKNIIILTLKCSILLVVIFAAAGPELWYQGERNDNDFVLAIDVSASMAATDFSPNRLDAAKDAALDFLDQLDSRAEIGLVSFSSFAKIEEPVTVNKQKVEEKIEELELERVGGTNLPTALITSTNLLLSLDRGKEIVLITDGSNTAEGIAQTLDDSIEYVKSKHVVVHTIGVGSEEGIIGYLPENITLPSIYDETLLQNISVSTGGSFYQADNEETLQSAFQEIVSASNKTFLNTDLTPALLLLGLIFLFIEWGLTNTRFMRVV